MARGQKRTFTEIKFCARCARTFPRNRKYSDAQWVGTAFCNRRCGAWNLGLTKADDPRIAAYAEGVRISAKGRPSWSKGLTKHTHPTLAIIAQKVSVAQRGKTINDAQRAGLARGRAWGRGRTKETCPIVARRTANLSRVLSGRKNPAHGAHLKALYAKHPEKHPNSIVARKTKGKGFTYIERAVADILDVLGVTYGYNVRIGTKWPDFSISSHSLLIEADGEYWHQDVTKETERDTYLHSLGWEIIHLPGKLIVNDLVQCRARIEAALGRCDASR